VSSTPKPAKSKLRQIIGAVIFVALVSVLLLMFRKPAPVATPMKPADVAAHAEAFQEKITSLASPPASDIDASTARAVVDEIHLTTDEVQAALMQANTPGLMPQGEATNPPTADSSSADQVSLASAPVVTFENDVVKGQFQSELAGKPVVVTVEGHLGAKDGYATFEPTRFKIGEVIVPVSMVNGELQKKMAEQRDRLKLPDFVSDISVQDGQLVIKRK
jgi:hypothetical protein